MSGEKARLAALRAARARTANTRNVKGKLGEDGIYDWVRFRGEVDARSFAALVEATAPERDPALVSCEKTREARFTGDLTWKVEFVVTPAINAYIMRYPGARLPATGGLR